MFEYFYNEIFRSVIIAFGSLFNDIEIRHKDAADEDFSIIRVPLAYGPTQKFLARMEQEANLNKPIQMTLPRMAFEFNGLEYDPTRKSTKTQKFVIQDGDGNPVQRGYLPVPYNMKIELSIMTKLNDDMLQIVEQILPYFQPSYSLPIKIENVDTTLNVPIVIDNIEMLDEYEGNFDTRRTLIYTLRFTAKTYIYGPTRDISDDIIKKASVGYVAGTVGSAGSRYERDITYQATPRAVKDYDGVVATLVAENVDMTTDIIEVDDGTKVTKGEYIYIGTESMYVKSITGNKVVVRRAQDNTTLENHVKGAQVFKLDAADNAKIEVGDDFGFSGTYF
jgi:hypothetical protein